MSVNNSFQRRLPSFNPSGSCPKCGSRNISVIYHNGGYLFNCPVLDFHREHMDRGCERCCYRWAEETMDSTHSSEEMHQ